MRWKFQLEEPVTRKKEGWLRIEKIKAKRNVNTTNLSLGARAVLEN